MPTLEEIAHDFNNLLSIIICNIELLQEKLPVDSQEHELARIALDASLRGADLTTRIFEFSRKKSLDPES
jgi:signal transduction histidine kinase